MSDAVHQYKASRLFTGDDWLSDQVIFVQNGKIINISSSTAGDDSLPSYPIIAPAFIDLQIYGAYDQLLAVYPTAEALHLLNDYCRKGGASHFQPTVATNSYEVFFKCIDAVREYWKSGGKGCIGLHVEGPWLNTIKRGAHIASFIHSPTLDEAKALLEYGKGVITMITVAPEVCNKEVIDLIHSYGIVVSAGHSNATYEEATKAFDEGIKTATHLYNAMSPLQHREPGIVGAILDHPTVMTSIVPDGYHVDFAALRIAKKVLQERLFVITDAVTETTEGAYPHHLAGDKYESNGILSGSALTMASSVRNLVNKCDIDLGEALRMVSLYPAKVMNKQDQMGKLALGFDANLVFLNDALEVVQLISE